MPKPKPQGSGYFALSAGLLFLGAFITSIAFDLRTISLYGAFQAWLLFAAAILVIWGAARVRTGAKQDFRIGQNTINFVVAIVGATIALLALVKQL